MAMNMMVDGERLRIMEGIQQGSRGLTAFADGCANPLSVPTVGRSRTQNSASYLDISRYFEPPTGRPHVGKASKLYASVNTAPYAYGHRGGAVPRRGLRVLVSSFGMSIAFRGPCIQMPQPQLARCSALISAHPRATRFAFSPYRHSMPTRRSRPEPPVVLGTPL